MDTLLWRVTERFKTHRVYFEVVRYKFSVDTRCLNVMMGLYILRKSYSRYTMKKPRKPSYFKLSGWNDKKMLYKLFLTLDQPFYIFAPHTKSKVKGEKKEIFILYSSILYDES